MFRTRVTDMLGIQYPLIVGTMGNLTFANFVAAVANAGAFCCIPSAFFSTAEDLRAEIRKAKSLSDKPFGVNINLFPSFRPVSNEKYIDICHEEGVKVIETSGRNPEHLIPRIKAGGAIAMHKCARVRDAVTAEKVGADIVEIAGTECGGHPSMEDVGSVVLVPRTVDELKVPVVGGGGFGDARGFVACLALGAEGVLMGTRFMLTQECHLPGTYKRAMLDAAEYSTALIQRSVDNPSRVLRNRLVEQILEKERKGTTLEELMPLIGGDRARNAMANGDFENGTLACGQVVGLLKDIPTVKEVVDSIINGAEQICGRLGLAPRQ